jgi:hypothetical protein
MYRHERRCIRHVPCWDSTWQHTDSSWLVAHQQPCCKAAGGATTTCFVYTTQPKTPRVRSTNWAPTSLRSVTLRTTRRNGRPHHRPPFGVTSWWSRAPCTASRFSGVSAPRTLRRARNDTSVQTPTKTCVRQCRWCCDGTRAWPTSCMTLTWARVQWPTIRSGAASSFSHAGVFAYRRCANVVDVDMHSVSYLDRLVRY